MWLSWIYLCISCSSSIFQFCCVFQEVWDSLHTLQNDIFWVFYFYKPRKKICYHATTSVEIYVRYWFSFSVYCIRHYYYHCLKKGFSFCHSCWRQNYSTNLCDERWSVGGRVLMNTEHCGAWEDPQRRVRGSVPYTYAYQGIWVLDPLVALHRD